MRGLLFAATAAAGILFVSALGLFASLACGVRWQAFERPVARLGRVPAVEAPDEPAVLTMTASDVDSVPEALEVRPRAAVREEEPPPVALGDVEPSAPRSKAARPKAAARKSAVLRRVGLGRARRALELGAPAAFDGGGSGAFSGGGRDAEVSGGEEGAASAPARAAPARARSFRAVTPPRGVVAPAPAPAQEEGGDEEPDGE